jgi:hypothetical protein
MNGQPDVDRNASGHRMTDSYLEAVILRRLAELNELRGGHVQNHGLSEDGRREYIANALLPKVSSRCILRLGAS